MRYFASAVIPDVDRCAADDLPVLLRGEHLASMAFDRFADAKRWLRVHRETWRGRVETSTHFETLIHDEEWNPAFLGRYPRDGWGDDGEEYTRAQLREMRRSADGQNNQEKR